MRPNSSLSIVILLVCLAGCAVGPNYHAPKGTAPGKFIALPQEGMQSTPATATATAVDLSQWWRSFNDTELNALIERAIRANPDIEIALTRLQEARMRYAGLVGGALPQVAASAAAGRGSGSDISRLGAAGPLRAGDNKGNLDQIRQ